MNKMETLTNIDEELKPCPHCGNKIQKFMGKDAPEWWINCENCSSFSNTKQQAVERWNMRANDGDYQEVIRLKLEYSV
jgi:ssDNA-binding Zn-finger/Zn-ribbon topoisomerase 1